MRIAIVVDIRLYREGLAQALARDGIEVVATAADGSAGVACVATTQPDIALLDMAMLDSISTVRTLAAQPQPPLERLTVRELEILELIDQGLTNKEIARRLCIELSTVKNHVHNILEKLQVRRRADAVLWARATSPR